MEHMGLISMVHDNPHSNPQRSWRWNRFAGHLRCELNRSTMSRRNVNRIRIRSRTVSWEEKQRKTIGVLIEFHGLFHGI
jgi:hypothetical protein